MLKTTYKSLLETNPQTLEKIVNRARSVKNAHFDGSTDPETWDWGVDFTDYSRQPSLYGYLSTKSVGNLSPKVLESLNEERTEDEKLLKEGVESVLKGKFEQKQMVSVINLNIGVSNFNSYTSSKEKVPAEIVKNFALKEYPAKITEAPFIKVYNDSFPTSPGINKLEISAVFSREDGGFSLITKQKNVEDYYDVYHLDPNNNTAVFSATIMGEDAGWNIKEGQIWEEMSDEQNWFRVSPEKISDKLEQVWGYYMDVESFNNNRKGFVLSALFPKDYFKLESVPYFDNEENIVVNSKVWEIEERMSDKEFLSKKWEMFDELLIEAEKKKNAVVEIVNKDTGDKVEVAKPTTLMGAIEIGDETTFKELVDKMKMEDNLEWLEDREDKPVVSFMLHVAANKGTPYIIDQLIELDADPYYVHRTPYGEGQFEFTTLISSAIKGNNVDNVKHLLDLKLTHIEQTNNCEYTLFMEAVLEKSFKVADELLVLGANLEAANLQQNTALHLAAAGNEPNLEAIKYLIDKKINPEIENFFGSIASELVGNEWDDLFQMLEDYSRAYIAKTDFSINDESIEKLKSGTEDNVEDERDELSKALQENGQNKNNIKF